MVILNWHLKFRVYNSTEREIFKFYFWLNLMDLFVAFSKWEFDMLKISGSRFESFSFDILNIALWKLLFSAQNPHKFSIQMLNYTLAF